MKFWSRALSYIIDEWLYIDYSTTEIISISNLNLILVEDWITNLKLIRRCISKWGSNCMNPFIEEQEKLIMHTELNIMWFDDATESIILYKILIKKNNLFLNPILNSIT